MPSTRKLVEIHNNPFNLTMHLLSYSWTVLSMDNWIDNKLLNWTETLNFVAIWCSKSRVDCIQNSKCNLMFDELKTRPASNSNARFFHKSLFTQNQFLLRTDLKARSFFNIKTYCFLNTSTPTLKELIKKLFSHCAVILQSFRRALV